MEYFISALLTACAARALLVSSHSLHQAYQHTSRPLPTEPLDAPALIRTYYCKPLNAHSHGYLQAGLATLPANVIGKKDFLPARYEACNPTLSLLYECNELWPGLKIAAVVRYVCILLTPVSC